MSIVAATDFNVHPYKIPNLTAVINTFNSFVTDAEQNVLIELFGYKMYKDYVDGLAATTQKWVDLNDGKEYTDSDGILNKYNGLKSLLVPYIFSNWLRATFDSNSGLGIVLANAENSNVISPATRISQTFEGYRRQVGVKLLKEGRNICGWCVLPNSMAGFIVANRTDYPDWQVPKIDMMNLWDL